MDVSSKWVYIQEILMKIIIYFLIKNDELLEKYNETWEKIKNNIEKEFSSESMYNGNYLKPKIKLSIECFYFYI